MNRSTQHRTHWSIPLVIIGLLFLSYLWLLPLNSQAASLPQGEVTNTPTATATATATQTATVTVTPTPTATHQKDFLPVVINQQPTSTSTSTPTPTGTVPTPTVTGTITPRPTIVVSVNPSEAKVGQKILFTVKLTNPGLAPARDAILSDSFPTTVDITSVSKTTQGIMNRQAHSLTVLLGDIMPNSIITVTIEINVNNTAKTTENLVNTITLNYDPNVTQNVTANYRVVVTGLPGTGQEPLESQPLPVDWSLLFLGGAMGLAGIFTLWYGYWIHEEQPGYGNRYWIIGGLLTVAGVAVGVIGSGWFRSTPASRPASAYAPTRIVENVAGYAIAPIYPTEDLTRYQFGEATQEVSELPDYPIPTPTIAPEAEPGVIVDTSPIVRIAIPAIDLDTVVKYVPFDGESWMIAGLKQEIAWLGNTSWPGLGSNTALAGHITLTGMGNGPFRYIDQLKTSDLVQVYTEEKLYTYQVREQMVVEEGDMSVTQPTDNPQITLITCTDWNDEFKLYIKRLIVIADLKDAIPLQVGSQINQ